MTQPDLFPAPQDQPGAHLAGFTEVESGRKTGSTGILEGAALVKVTGATLVSAKLDRLSRNAVFLLTLRNNGARFAAVDLVEANDLPVGIMALLAEAEREVISRRIKEAVAVAKARGVRLGNPNGPRASDGQGRALWR